MPFDGKTHRIFRQLGRRSWMLGLELGEGTQPQEPRDPRGPMTIDRRVEAEVEMAARVFNEVHGTTFWIRRVEWMGSTDEVEGVFGALACELLANVMEGNE